MVSDPIPSLCTPQQHHYEINGIFPSSSKRFGRKGKWKNFHLFSPPRFGVGREKSSLVLFLVGLHFSSSLSSLPFFRFWGSRRRREKRNSRSRIAFLSHTKDPEKCAFTQIRQKMCKLSNFSGPFSAEKPSF